MNVAEIEITIYANNELIALRELTFASLHLVVHITEEEL